MKTFVLISLFLCSICMLQSQTTPTSQSSSTQSPDVLQLTNRHILLTAPGVKNSEPLWIAVSPTGELAILPVSQVEKKLGEGYRPYTFGELRTALAEAFQQNEQLTAEVTRLRNALQAAAPSQRFPTEGELRAQRVQAEAVARQQAEMQKRELLMRYILGMRPQTLNINICDPTKTVCPR